MLPLFHTLYFEATRNCNLLCRYCSTKSNTKSKFDDIPAGKIIDRIFHPAWELGTRMIDFSGGEFLLRKDAFQLLKEAHDIGFKISIVTNGTTVNQKVIDKLRDVLGENILISLGINSFDAENAETRDFDYKKTLSLISLLEKNNITINLCVTIGKFNADHFADTIKQIDDLKIPYNRIPFSPRNTSCKELMFDKETMMKKIHPVLLKYFRGYVSYVPFFLDPAVYLEKTGQEIKMSIVPTNPSVGCWVGSFYGISPEGEVAPCPLLLDHVSGGNVLKTNLKDILFQSDLFTKVVKRKEIKGKCGPCKYNYTCGGCRVMAYYQSGDIMAEDPTCFIDKISEEELLKMENETARQFNNYRRMTSFGGVFRKDEE
jgi:radical SAM protein with 4Fe4S-binding SPASM domain